MAGPSGAPQPLATQAPESPISNGSNVGRPSKYSEELVAQLLEAIEAGATFKLACDVVGISEVIFYLWCKEKPGFRERVDAASGKGDLARIKKIDGHGEQSWQSLAWLLERRRPLEYGRQAAQINVSANAAAAVSGGNG